MNSQGEQYLLVWSWSSLAEGIDRRWTTDLAQKSNMNGIMPCMCCIFFGLTNTAAFCLGRYSLHLLLLMSSMVWCFVVLVPEKHIRTHFCDRSGRCMSCSSRTTSFRLLWAAASSPHLPLGTRVAVGEASFEWSKHLRENRVVQSGDCKIFQLDHFPFGQMRLACK